MLIQDGYNGNLPGYRRVVMSFWFSLACTSLLKKVTDDGKKTEYLEVVIDTEIHKKLTKGWRPSQNPRYVIYDVGLRFVGNIDKKNLDLKSDPALVIKKEIEDIPSSDEEDEETTGMKIPNRALDLQNEVEYVPSPPPKKPLTEQPENLATNTKETVDSFGFTNLLQYPKSS